MTTYLGKLEFIVSKNPDGTLTVKSETDLAVEVPVSPFCSGLRREMSQKAVLFFLSMLADDTDTLVVPANVLSNKSN